MPEKSLRMMVEANLNKASLPDLVNIYYFIKEKNIKRLIVEARREIMKNKDRLSEFIENKYIQYFLSDFKIGSMDKLVNTFRFNDTQVDGFIVDNMASELDKKQLLLLYSKASHYLSSKEIQNSSVSMLAFLKAYLTIVSNLKPLLSNSDNKFNKTYIRDTELIKNRLSSIIGLGDLLEITQVIGLTFRYFDIKEVFEDLYPKLDSINVKWFIEKSKNPKESIWIIVNWLNYYLKRQNYSLLVQLEDLMLGLYEKEKRIYLSFTGFSLLFQYLHTKRGLILKKQYHTNYQFESRIIPFIDFFIKKYTTQKELSFELVIRIFRVIRGSYENVQEKTNKDIYLVNIKRMEFVIIKKASQWRYADDYKLQFLKDYKKFCIQNKIGSKKGMSIIEMAFENTPLHIREKLYQEFLHMKSVKMDLEKKQGKRG